jgi:hypothetical protein
MHPRQPHPGRVGQASQSEGGGVPGPFGCLACSTDRPGCPAGDPAADGPSDRGWQRHEDDLVALNDHAQHPMAVFLAEVSESAPVASKIRVGRSESLGDGSRGYGPD